MENELGLDSYNGVNGITIYCSCCGSSTEETVNGYYPPIKYESDKYNRQCLDCLRNEGMLD